MDTRVSILTISQGSRIPFLALQFEKVMQQTYTNIIEWVIVDGSKSFEDSAKLRSYIEHVGQIATIPIKFIPWQHPQNIGALRNLGNKQCDGDIVVCMDDDDYYQDGYVEHAVETLVTSPKRAQIAGCSPIFMYDMEWRVLVQSHMFGENHSVNNCFAYTREYHQTHTYDESVTFAEESSYLNTHQGGVALEQMDPYKCVVHMIHKGNTYHKSRMVVSALCKIPVGAVLTDVSIDTLISKQSLQRYCDILGDHPTCPYDIVYYCGIWSNVWHPSDPSLAGSEQAVVQLSKAWARRGLRVAVYGEFPDDVHGSIIDNVMYFQSIYFTPRQHFHTLICWRIYGTMPILTCPSKVDARQVMIDLHDNLYAHYEVIDKYLNTPASHHIIRPRLMFKSRFHVTQYEESTNTQLQVEQYDIVMNGIQTDVFKNGDDVRDPYRLCYCSCYHRGLLQILEKLWPHIKELEPRAELHIYYGLREDEDGEFVRSYQQRLIVTKGVCDHGRQPITMIAREKHRANFQLYLTDTHAETDCISIRESLVAGCIPLLLDIAVFKERHGIHFNPMMSCEEIAKHVVALMHDPKGCEAIRDKLRASSTIGTWTECADGWLRSMQK